MNGHKLIYLIQFINSIDQDCNWGDHCADVTANFGVVSQRTPRGMQLSEFYQGLEKYRKEAMARNNES